MEKTFSVFSVEVVLIRNEFHLLLPNESRTDYLQQANAKVNDQRSGEIRTRHRSFMVFIPGFVDPRKKEATLFYLFVGERAAAKALNFLLKNV